MVSNIKLTLCTTVKMRVEVFNPNSAERRLTTKGPNAKGPRRRGPSRSNSQDRLVTLAPGSSCGERTARVAAVSPVGNIMANKPTRAPRNSNSSNDRHQIRTGRPLAKVIKRSATTKPIRHNEPASTGVSRNINTQASFKRGSRRRNQPELPATYCPIGS
ncbi:MAG: Uncharacterised protein [Prochlorococcus marinus str. MIT 9313]|nr:MAG: Uncharacterised protein [Prochlorococcus marinus str. MIT 9313]